MMNRSMSVVLFGYPVEKRIFSQENGLIPSRPCRLKIQSSVFPENIRSS